MSYRNPKLLKAAKDQACASCGAIGTTVSCHLRSVALGCGVGIKAPDCLVAWLCQRCHNIVDNRVPGYTREERKEMWWKAFARTVVEWFEQGIVIVK